MNSLFKFGKHVNHSFWLFVNRVNINRGFSSEEVLMLGVTVDDEKSEEFDEPAKEQTDQVA